uniref:CCHC-type domain-containing protein n=1 Tax=Leptobrachium leishanense TaxID=445787 RepID=A0A8C5PE96_9ANUR
IGICRRFWQAFSNATAGSPFSRFLSNCPLKKDEKRVTVQMWNPLMPNQDVATFLRRYCTVIREPQTIMHPNGLGSGRLSVIVQLRPDASSPDGLAHLPQSFTLGNSVGILYYPGQPRCCRRCGREGHKAKICTADSCKVCKTDGHATKDCP